MALDYMKELCYLGGQIRQGREDIGMSQEKFAEAMGISVSTLYRFENGIRALPMDLLFCAAEVLEVPISALLPPRFCHENYLGREFPKDPKEIKLKRDVLKLSSRDRMIVYDTISALVGSMLSIQDCNSSGMTFDPYIETHEQAKNKP